MRAIRRLGLKVSPAKRVAIWFYDWRSRGAPSPGLCLDINGEDIDVGLQMKYLGFTINRQWTFGPHFRLLVSKVMAAANALCGLLPNIGGAGVGVCRVYKGVVRSRVLYGAPVLTRDLMARCRSLLLLRRLHRTPAIRIIRGYGTVSYASVPVLAASPSICCRPWRGLGSSGDTSPGGQVARDVRREARREVWEWWRSNLLAEV